LAQKDNNNMFTETQTDKLAFHPNILYNIL